MDEVGNDNQGTYQQPAAQSMPQQGQAPTPPIHHHKMAFILGIIVVVVVIAVIGAILSVYSRSASLASQSTSTAPSGNPAALSPRAMLINDLSASKSISNAKVSYLLSISLPPISEKNIT